MWESGSLLRVVLQDSCENMFTIAPTIEILGIRNLKLQILENGNTVVSLMAFSHLKKIPDAIH